MHTFQLDSTREFTHAYSTNFEAVFPGVVIATRLTATSVLAGGGEQVVVFEVSPSTPSVTKTVEAGTVTLVLEVIGVTSPYTLIEPATVSRDEGFSSETFTWWNGAASWYVGPDFVQTDPDGRRWGAYYGYEDQQAGVSVAPFAVDPVEAGGTSGTVSATVEPSVVQAGESVMAFFVAASAGNEATGEDLVHQRGYWVSPYHHNQGMESAETVFIFFESPMVVGPLFTQDYEMAADPSEEGIGVWPPPTRLHETSRVTVAGIQFHPPVDLLASKTGSAAYDFPAGFRMKQATGRAVTQPPLNSGAAPRSVQSFYAATRDEQFTQNATGFVASTDYPPRSERYAQTVVRLPGGAEPDPEPPTPVGGDDIERGSTPLGSRVRFWSR